MENPTEITNLLSNTLVLNKTSHYYLVSYINLIIQLIFSSMAWKAYCYFDKYEITLSVLYTTSILTMLYAVFLLKIKNYLNTYFNSKNNIYHLPFSSIVLSYSPLFCALHSFGSLIMAIYITYYLHTGQTTRYGMLAHLILTILILSFMIITDLFTYFKLYKLYSTSNFFNSNLV